MTPIPDELLQQMIASGKPSSELFGPGSLFHDLATSLIHSILRAELHYHVEREKLLGLPNRSNGSSKKQVLSPQGPLELDVPRDRLGSFQPLLIPKHSRHLPSLSHDILALYSRGLSVREIQSFLLDSYHVEVSHDFISSVTDSVLTELKAWQSRPLASRYAVLWIDAMFFPIRRDGVVQKCAVYVVIGLRMDGKKEVLGFWVETTEGARLWMTILNELKHRGVQDVLFCCCDGLKGLAEALDAAFPKGLVQTCVVHQVRASLSSVSYKDKNEVAKALKEVYNAPNEQDAKEKLEKVAQKWGKQYPEMLKSWHQNWQKLAPCFGLPQELKKLVYTTNTIESFNAKAKRVISSKGQFPDEESLKKQLYLIVQNMEKKYRGTIQNWQQLHNQLVIYFGSERFELNP